MQFFSFEERYVQSRLDGDQRCGSESSLIIVEPLPNASIREGLKTW